MFQKCLVLRGNLSTTFHDVSKKYIVNRFEGDKILTFLPSCLETIFDFFSRPIDYFFSFNQFSSGSVVILFGAESVVGLISTQNKNLI